MTFKSERGIPLLLTNNVFADVQDVVTVELWTKWYRLYLVRCATHDVEHVDFDDLPVSPSTLGGSSSYVDHVPNPVAVREYCDRNDYMLDPLAEELIVGRWNLEVLS